MTTLADVLALAQRNARVCLRPPAWCALYELLPQRRSDAYGPIPPPPLLHALWEGSSDELKRERLREHLAWAAEHGALPRVHAWLLLRPERDWHHEGD